MNIENIVDITINGRSLSFQTAPGLFSPRSADAGTLAMLEAALPCFVNGAKVLDLGCGYGLAGVFAAMLCGAERVYMSDIDCTALNYSKKNVLRNGISPMPKIIKSDCYRNIDTAGFDLILSNPPYHSDFSLPKEIIEKGFNRLAVNGRLFMVTKRLDWYKNKLSAVFGGVSVMETGGYYVFNSRKRGMTRADKK